MEGASDLGGRSWVWGLVARSAPPPAPRLAPAAPFTPHSSPPAPRAFHRHLAPAKASSRVGPSGNPPLAGPNSLSIREVLQPLLIIIIVILQPFLLPEAAGPLAHRRLSRVDRAVRRFPWGQRQAEAARARAHATIRPAAGGRGRSRTCALCGSYKGHAHQLRS